VNDSLPGAKRGSVEATFRSSGEATYSKPWQRKSIRLPADSYVGAGAYLLTLVTSERRPWFEVENSVRACESELHESAARQDFELLAYVFMPEHLHVLAQGQEHSRLSRFVKDFKQRTGFHFKREHRQDLWQRGYHDHAMRNDESLGGAALYIAQNPMRRGLVTEWTQYANRGGVLLRDLAGDLKVAATIRGDASS
jgi:REP element-mobilizing transposase RayT